MGEEKLRLQIQHEKEKRSTALDRYKSELEKDLIEIAKYLRQFEELLTLCGKCRFEYRNIQEKSNSVTYIFSYSDENDKKYRNICVLVERKPFPEKGTVLLYTFEVNCIFFAEHDGTEEPYMSLERQAETAKGVKHFLENNISKIEEDIRHATLENARKTDKSIPASWNISKLQAAENEKLKEESEE